MDDSEKVARLRGLGVLAARGLPNPPVDMTAKLGLSQLVYPYTEALTVPAGPVTPVTPSKTVRRNEPCPCKSGRKYKKCCGKS